MTLPPTSIQPFPLRVILTIVTAVTLLAPGTRAATQQLICSPGSLRFGTVAVGLSESQILTLTNNGQSVVTISGISVDDSEFSAVGLSLPLAIPAGQSATFNIIFAPTAIGWTNGRITVTSNASNPSLGFQVAGTGVTSEALTASPATLSFGQVIIGKSSTLQVVLTNAHSSKLTITAFQSNASAYSVSGPSLPVTVPAGQSITLSVAFAPQATGLSGGSIFVAGPALNIPLSGTGATVGQISVSPASLNFGSVDLGMTATQPSTLTATGGSVTITSAVGSNTQFGIGGVSFPVTLNAGQSLPFTVSFAPQTTGQVSAGISFASTATNQLQESVAGTGTAPSVTLSWSPSMSQVAGYNVYRGTAVGVYSKINSKLDTNTTYADGAVTPGATYYYAATAVDSAGEESGYSAPIMVTVP